MAYKIIGLVVQKPRDAGPNCGLSSLFHEYEPTGMNALRYLISEYDNDNNNYYYYIYLFITPTGSAYMKYIYIN